jgi:hypothetical protein
LRLSRGLHIATPTISYVAKVPLEQMLLSALRSGPERTLGELAQAVGFPRTNYGRTVHNRVRKPVQRLVTQGLIEQHGRRYRVSERGRRALADSALNSVPGHDNNEGVPEESAPDG